MTDMSSTCRENEYGNTGAQSGADTSNSSRDTATPWLANYPAGVPADIDLDALPNLVCMFDQACRRFADLPAYYSFGTTLTYREVDRLSRQFAAWLQTSLALKQGDRVAIMLPNCLQYPVAVFGILRAGGVVVNVNPLYTPRELEAQLQDAGARAILVLENFAHVVAAVEFSIPAEKVIVSGIGDLLGGFKKSMYNAVCRYIKRQVPAYSLVRRVWFTDTLHTADGASLTAPALTSADPAFLQYTGGTTGVSKGAVLTHGNMTANTLQAHAWFSGLLEEGEEAVITALPLYHIFALTANCLLFTHIGGLNVLISNPRDLPPFIKTLKSVRFTAMTGVNTLFAALLRQPELSDVDFSRLKLALGGGMAVRRDTARRWREVTGATLLEAYGLTETSPAACINPVTLEEYNGKIGLPISSTHCRVRTSNGALAGAGEVGELEIKGPQVMQGYWNRPDETAHALSPDGWLRTGDVATMDAGGYIEIVDRMKDMVLVSGFCVYPNEVEKVLVSHPGVHEAGAIGVPDERSGEAVKAVVVRSDPTLSADDLIAHCRGQLAQYKVPRQVEFRDSLPKSNVGKILRRALRDETASTRR